MLNELNIFAENQKFAQKIQMLIFQICISKTMLKLMFKGQLISE